MKIDRNWNLILATYLVGDKIWWAGHVFCILHSAKRTDRPVEPTRLSCRQGWGTWRNSNLSSTTRLGYSRPRYYRRWIDSKHITFIPFSAKLIILSVLEIQHYSCFAGRARDRRVVISTYPPVHGDPASLLSFGARITFIQSVSKGLTGFGIRLQSFHA